MRFVAALLVVAACHTPVIMSAPSMADLPAAADTTVLAPSIIVPVAAESEYVALDPNDPRLGQACDELAYLVAHGGTVTTDIATAVLRMHGIVDPPNRVVAGDAGESLDGKLGEDRLRPNVMIGRGTFEHTAVEVMLLLPRIRIGPVPRAAESPVEISVVLDAALRDPRITIADAYDSSQASVPLSEHVSHFTVPCGAQPSERFVTIEANDPRHETKPLVIFPIYCHLKPPSTLAVEPAQNLAGFTDLAGRLTAILNRERVAAGLPPLRRDGRVEAAALAYASARARNHNADRQVVMRDAGLIAPAMSWSTFHVDSIEGAIDRILNSAEELAKVRNPERTDLGVGALRDADGWWISIIYVTIPLAIDTTAAATRIAHGIQLVEQNRSVQVKIDPFANRVATHYANALAFGWRTEDLQENAIVEMQMANGVGSDFATDNRVELANLDIVKLIGNHVFHTIGVGVSQSARAGPLAGTIWIVVVFY